MSNTIFLKQRKEEKNANKTGIQFTNCLREGYEG